jgi:transcriptional regulator with XRE-family HTH domain
MVDAEIRRLARLLEALVRVRKVPVRPLERRLGFGAGTLNRIFNGRIDLKIRHILLVLEDLEVKPAQFFALAYEAGTETVSAEQLLERLQRRGLAGPEAPAPVALTVPELRTAMMDVLQELGLLPR